MNIQHIKNQYDEIFSLYNKTWNEVLEKNQREIYLIQDEKEKKMYQYKHDLICKIINTQLQFIEDLILIINNTKTIENSNLKRIKKELENAKQYIKALGGNTSILTYSDVN